MKIHFFLALYMLCGVAFASNRIVDAKIEAQPLSVVFELQGSKPTLKLFSLHNPERIVVDFADTSASIPWERLAKQSVAIQSIRHGMHPGRIYRIVIDVDKAYRSTWQYSAIRPSGNHRIRIQLTAIEQKQRVSNSPLPQKVATRSPPQKLRDVIVVIDPGHGGKDPGAIGPTNKKEKNVVLAIAKRLKRIIDKQSGMKAVLTRTSDYYIGLRERLQIARKANADIFVAIHADAFKNKQSNGASVFALSQRGATSEAARWLAEKENYSELGGVNLSELDDDDGMVRSVLLDLSQTATISAGVNMGGRILRQLGVITRLHNSKVEQARFVVLKSPDIPSVLVETGFISNPREERNLTSARYQERLAQAIYKGIKNYFWRHPPYGSLVEAMAMGKAHIVRNGDTLSGIAVRYHVSMQNIKAVNRMKGNRLRIGQKILIPSSSSWA